MAGSRFTPAAWSALAFALAYLTAAGIGALAVGDREFLVYLVVVGGATATVAWLHRRARFSPAVLWGVSLLGAIHMAGGLVRPPMSWPIDGRRVLYNLWLVPEWLKYDQAVHFYGSAMATWACWQSLRVYPGSWGSPKWV